MSPEAWYTLAVLAAMFVALVRELLSADVVVFGALVALWLGGVIDTDAAGVGLANPMVRPGAKVVPQKAEITAKAR